MGRRHCARAANRIGSAAALAIGLCAAALAPVGAQAQGSLASRANEATSTQASTYKFTEQQSDFQPAFRLNYVRRSESSEPNSCQVPLPPVGAVSPFPLALRLGAMVSPRTKFAGGIDATIKGVHLFPGFTTRVDADAIIGVSFKGISTLIPVTFDQIYNLNLPVSSRIYLGGGIGPYFGTITRFGGKVVVGAEFNRIGLEGGVHFSGTGDPLLTVQARLGL